MTYLRQPVHSWLIPARSNNLQFIPAKFASDWLDCASGTGLVKTNFFEPFFGVVLYAAKVTVYGKSRKRCVPAIHAFS
jgi:hypothetical protein